MAVAIDLITLVLILGMTYALTSEGLWGAALMFFNTLFAGLIAFNFYEPLAALIAENATFMANFADVTALMSIFLASLLLLRLTTDSLGPSMVRFPTALYHPGRFLFAALASVVMAGIVILAYETSPVQSKLLGVFDWKYMPLYGRRFDRDFLAFFQYTSGNTFARNGAGGRDPIGEFPNKPMLFDPKAEWLLNHQKQRPYQNMEPEDDPSYDPSEATASATPAAGGTPGAPGAPGAQTPGGPR